MNANTNQRSRISRRISKMIAAASVALLLTSGSAVAASGADATPNNPETPGWSSELEPYIYVSWSVLWDTAIKIRVGQNYVNWKDVTLRIYAGDSANGLLLDQVTWDNPRPAGGQERDFLGVTLGETYFLQTTGRLANANSATIVGESLVLTMSTAAPTIKTIFLGETGDGNGPWHSTDIDLTTTVGVIPHLPLVFNTRWSNGAFGYDSVDWDEISAEAVAHPGTFTIHGVAKDVGLAFSGDTLFDVPLTATITVVGTGETPSPTPNPTPPAVPSPTPPGDSEPGGTVNGAQVVTVPRGAVVAVAAHGFEPGEDVVATLHSTPVSLGTFPANDAGEVAFQARIPAGTTEGSHSIVLTGVSSGTTVTLAVNVTSAGGHIPAAANG